MNPKNASLPRRTFLGQIARSGAAAALTLPISTSLAASGKPGLEVGEGVVDTTPPLGIEMAGFHRPEGKERRITGIRKPAAARALVLQMGDTRTAIVSLDILGISKDMTARVQSRVARKVGMSAKNVRVCATHTHSMPTFCFLRQWGALAPEYMASVESKIVQAVEMAQADLAPAELTVGKAVAPGASNNRTVKEWKTEDQFGEDSGDDQRWLDRTVHVLHFQRSKPKKNVLWYHFTAHPVCYRDDLAGPDWPGLVEDSIQQKLDVRPSFLQGHCGDVNAGDAEHWIGTAENTANPVTTAICQAVDSAKTVRVDELRIDASQCPLPLDLKRFNQWLTDYRDDPSKCSSGPWVDARFAKAWFEASSKRKTDTTHTSVPLTAMKLGEVGLVFHPAELYTCYGLMIQRDSPFENTLVVGYSDDIIGYLPDPKAYEAGEYSAITVPKILDLPPFTPTAARELATNALSSLKKLVG